MNNAGDFIKDVLAMIQNGYGQMVPSSAVLSTPPNPEELFAPNRQEPFDMRMLKQALAPVLEDPRCSAITAAIDENVAEMRVALARDMAVMDKEAMKALENVLPPAGWASVASCLSDGDFDQAAVRTLTLAGVSGPALELGKSEMKEKSTFHASEQMSKPDEAIAILNNGKESQTEGILNFLEAQKTSEALRSDTGLTEADAMVISHLAYMIKLSTNPEYKRIALKKDISIAGYCNELIAELSKGYENVDSNDLKFLKQLRDCGRYNSLMIAGNEGKTSGSISDHLIVVEYADQGAFMGFEGTDGTVNGWYTNIEFGTQVDSDAEMWSREMFERYAEKYEHIDLTGHSRGGHLAIYALLTTYPYLANRVKTVYSLDGPGFNAEFMNKYAAKISEYDHLIHNYRPYNSVVGELLHGIGDVTHIDAVGTYFVSHDGYAWTYDKDGHLVPQDLDLLSNMVNELSCWLVEHLTKEELEIFGYALFDLMRDYEKDPYGSRLSFDTIGTNLLKEIMSGDFENLFVLIGTIATLIDRGLLEEFLPPEAVLIFRKLIERFPLLEKVYIDIKRLVKTVATIYALYSKFVTWMREMQRAAYLRDNPMVSIDMNALESITASLERANEYLAEADGLYKRLYRHVEFNLLDLLGNLIKASKFAVLLLVDAGSGRSAKISKLKNAIGRVAQFWAYYAVELSHALGGNVSGGRVTVAPAVLKQRAESMMSEIEKYESATKVVKDKIEELYHKRGWRGEDYNRYKTQFDDEYTRMIDTGKDAKRYAELLASIAKGYSVAQNDSITEIQRR